MIEMREFEIEVLIVPPVYMEELGLATVRREKRKIRGYTLEDAKKRAGIT